MKEKADIDYIISWHGFGYPHRIRESWDSLCRVRIWEQKPVIVLFSDLNEENTGTSITNCSENLAIPSPRRRVNSFYLCGNSTKISPRSSKRILMVIQSKKLRRTTISN